MSDNIDKVMKDHVEKVGGSTDMIRNKDIDDKFKMYTALGVRYSSKELQQRFLRKEEVERSILFKVREQDGKKVRS